MVVLKIGPLGPQRESNVEGVRGDDYIVLRFSRIQDDHSDTAFRMDNGFTVMKSHADRRQDSSSHIRRPRSGK